MVVLLATQAFGSHLTGWFERLTGRITTTAERVRALEDSSRGFAVAAGLEPSLRVCRPERI
jgi:hypothetical protein